MYFENGRVGIGAPPKNGYHRLYVADGITTEEVKVRIQTLWSDYVFDNNYRLLPLAELKNFISNNKHLPDVPTEEEVKKNGIELGQMNAVLLKKIEELTLYVLQLKEEVNELKRNAKN